MRAELLQYAWELEANESKSRVTLADLLTSVRIVNCCYIVCNTFLMCFVHVQVPSMTSPVSMCTSKVGLTKAM